MEGDLPIIYLSMLSIKSNVYYNLVNKLLNKVKIKESWL
jgi:hypothetical protein